MPISVLRGRVCRSLLSLSNYNVFLFQTDSLSSSTHIAPRALATTVQFARSQLLVLATTGGPDNVHGLAVRHHVADAERASLLRFITQDLLEQCIAAAISTGCCCCTVPPSSDYEPTESSLVGEESGRQDGESQEAASRLVTRRTSATDVTNDLAAILTGVTATVLLLAALLTFACFWQRRRCISCLSKHCVLHLYRNCLQSCLNKNPSRHCHTWAYPGIRGPASQ